MNTRIHGLGKFFVVVLVSVMAVSAGLIFSVRAQEGSPNGAAGVTPGLPQSSTALFQASGKVTTAYHSETGKLSFVGAEPGAFIPQPGVLAAGATPDEAARNFLASYGLLFGISDPATDLAVMSEDESNGRSYMRYQQVYQGVPILGAELIVQMDGNKNVLSASGEALPDISLSTSPRISADRAGSLAMESVAKKYGTPLDSLKIASPGLWVYNPLILGAPGIRQDRLVWRTEVTTHELKPVRELVLVDAQLGAVLLSYSEIDTSLYRTIYDNNNDATKGLPGNGPVRTEGSPPTGNQDADLAYDFLGATYNFYLNYHGRDSLNGVGMGLISTVRYCPDPNPIYCPYQNAFWNGTQMVFGQGYASADDVVAHELTHGVTENTSRLFYYMQSGAINESFSDLWGEFVDLTDGRGNDSPSVRWLMGEDIGAIRSMSDPPAYGDPDKMSSPNYSCNATDGGGVHTNSGVNNKAVFLMTDGGTFNGYTIAGLGITKVAKIYYEVQTHLLTSAADYQDLGLALRQACTNLVGTSGITSSDCGQVNKAVDATEMSRQPTCDAGEASLCNASLLNSDFNGSATGWYLVDATQWYVDSNYLYTSGTADNSFSSVTTADSYSEIDFQANLRRYGSDSYSNGLVVRGTHDPLGAGNRWNSGYAFLYTRNGYYSVWRFDHGVETALKEWMPSSAINTGDSWNTLRVLTEGPILSFYINGVRLWSGIDTAYKEGTMGLIMYRPTGGTGDLFQVDWATINGGSALDLFSDDMENPISGNWSLNTLLYGNQWFYPQTANPYAYDPTYGSGAYNLWGYDQPIQADYAIEMTPWVTIPSGKNVTLHFDHAYNFENSYDGGVLEYKLSPNGPWTDAGSLFTSNGYNGTISSAFNNPLAGRSAFVTDSRGATSSRLSLNSLAGQSVRFRFRIGTDSGGDGLGWFVDNFRIYTCEAKTYSIYAPLLQKSGNSLEQNIHSSFNGNANGWQVHSGIWTPTPINIVSPGINFARSSISYPYNYNNVWFQVRMMRNGCIDCANALLLRGTPNPLDPLVNGYHWYSSYMFQYVNNGQFSVYKRVSGGGIDAIQGWTPSSAINASDLGGDYWNVLTVMANGSNLYFYINGVLVWSGSDPYLTSGRVGMSFYKESGRDQLNVDWATVQNVPLFNTPSAFGLLESVSPEQQALNTAANQAASGSVDTVPSH